MSLRSDGRYRCDRCGADVGNGGIEECTTVVMLDVIESAGIMVPTPVTLQFCREPRTGYPNGCTGRVITDANLANYHSRGNP